MTRNWVNGTRVRQLTLGARRLQPRSTSRAAGSRSRALFGDDWSATLTYSYQRQSTLGAWDQDPALAPRTVQRFGPESHDFEAKTLDFHLDGDVGIGDLVFASTYWSLPTRQQNEYSQYMENYDGGVGISRRAGGTHLPGRPGVRLRAFYAAARCRCSSTSTTPTPSAGRTSCASSPSRAGASTGSAASTGRRPPTRTPAVPTTCPASRPQGSRSSTTTTSTTHRSARLRSRLASRTPT